MTDGIEFGNEAARFGYRDAAYLVDVLRGAYTIASASGEDCDLIADFIEALETCDCINLFDDELVIDEA